MVLSVNDLSPDPEGPRGSRLMHYVTQTSKIIDGTYPDHLCKEARERRKIDKIGEEMGEVFEAYSGMLGENPRKGVTHSFEEVLDEILDVAATALGAYEQLTGWHGLAVPMLASMVERKHARLVAALQDAA